ncbi:olfactory receptor 140-like isoform X2 [Vombatus ursinus]|uniref:olfactory receptor 140-like isoform X2 n=1 Tax=Vombatus ursinus TaxID=29139 RepID=UPI000FFD19FC|nr:olfactory receptor 140-like isoform X2 [Vombatus ursinus]
MGKGWNVTEFVLLGLMRNPEMQKVIFAIFLITYIITIMSNMLIVITIASSQTLVSPMYFFLAFLSLIDAFYPSSMVPKMLVDLLREKKTISFNACMTQLFLEHFLGTSEIVLLIIMAFDRYVAICRPLHYMTIMNHRLCCCLVGLAWTVGFLHSLGQIFTIVWLPFCGPNVIDHFVCDIIPLIQLACTDTFLIGLLVIANAGLISMISFVVLMFSYVIILRSLISHSSAGRRKALSTCSSHVTVVILFFVPCMFMYLRPVTTFSMDKIITVFYTLVTPMLNPLIYTVRNEEVKNAMRKLWSRKVASDYK